MDVVTGLTAEQIGRAADNVEVAERALQLATVALGKIPVTFDENGQTLYRANERAAEAQRALDPVRKAIRAAVPLEVG